MKTLIFTALVFLLTTCTQESFEPNTATKTSGELTELTAETLDGLVKIEGEDFQKNTAQGNHSWEIFSDNDASGSQAMQALPDSRTNNNEGYVSKSPRLDYQVNFSRSGTYYVWVRGKAVGNAVLSSNSVHVGLDGKAVASADKITGFEQNFSWKQGTMDGPDAQLTVETTGTHTVNVWMREDGFSLDKLILTLDASFVPSDEAPIVYGPPIVITKGGTYRGHWESTNPNTPAVLIRTSEPVVIENATIRSRGHLVHAEHGYNVNLVVRNVAGYGLNPNVAGKFPGRFLLADTYSMVRIENNYLEGTSGMWFHESRPGATVKILRNQAKNINGRLSNGNEGWQTGQRAFVQFAQLDKGYGLVDTEVAWNQIINEPYKSRTEDVINFYKTSGASAQDPILIHDNYIQGAYPSDFVGSEEGEYSGGGIMLGDGGGEYLEAFNNQVVSTSNYGMAIAGGQHNKIYNNRVISTGKLADGTYIVSSYGAGFYLANYSQPAPFGDNIGYDNLSGWVNKGEAYAWANYRNDWWIENPDVSQWKNNAHWEGALTLETERVEFAIFQNKLKQNSIAVGPSTLK